jgi:hypothetical protein
MCKLHTIRAQAALIGVKVARPSDSGAVLQVFS